jgi:hypothetical protein
MMIFLNCSFIYSLISYRQLNPLIGVACGELTVTQIVQFIISLFPYLFANHQNVYVCSLIEISHTQIHFIHYGHCQ